MLQTERTCGSVPARVAREGADESCLLPVAPAAATSAVIFPADDGGQGARPLHRAHQTLAAPSAELQTARSVGFPRFLSEELLMR